MRVYCKVIVKVWFKAPLTLSAPLQDLTFLKDLIISGSIKVF